jgi:hypothetical protein
MWGERLKSLNLMYAEVMMIAADAVVTVLINLPTWLL